MEQKRTTVGKTTSTIELNGKRYNARTGVVVDGFLSSNKPVSSPAKPMRAPVVSRTQTTSKKMHKSTQPSRTLMRYAVKKPSTITTRKTIAMDVVQQAQNQAVATHFHTADPTRIKRANAIPQLSTISRFGIVSSKASAAQPPAAAQAAKTVSPPAAPKIMSEAAHHTGAQEVINKGLRAANSHEVHHQPKKAKLHHRIGRKLGLSSRATSVAAGGLSVMLLGAFFAYQNVPSISVRYASAKAGVHATLPGYRPSGFALTDRVKYEPGEVALAYKANADSRSYVVTQKTTSWNSEALQDHLTATSKMSPQTFPENGRTIYLHDGDQADWIEGGVWYSISGKSDLNTDQLIKIATSI